MKILVVDIETTGFNTRIDAIVEIGIALVDTKTKEIEIVFDQVVKDDKFKPKYHSNAWIFENTTLTVNDVINAKPLEDYREEIQELFDKYPMTAFNKSFDLRFLKAKKFTCNDIKCLMHTAYKYTDAKDKNGRKKRPSVEETYNTFFANNKEQYVEQHRAGADAKDEAKILLHMVELKQTKKVTLKDKLTPKTKTPQTNAPKYKPIGPHDKFPFGKFKDKIFSDLVISNPKYINWCIKNVKGFELTNEAQKLIK